MPQVRTNDERIQQLATSCVQNDNIEKALYSQYKSCIPNIMSISVCAISTVAAY